MRSLCSLSLAALLLAARIVHAGSGAEAGATLPPGWTPVAASALHGNFRHAGHQDITMLARNGAAYGVLLLPGDASGGNASVVRTFGAGPANPPQLSLVHPGSYRPACHDGGYCAAVDIATDAIGLCHGEASCEIIYFKDNTFHNLTTTD
ncbi:hypothetical protein FHW58_002161 [Duganella sp. 1224]|uniref:hypothetical protein n=1 Tax=Duganella sp. 1224 TaxID=2587052 RepID=UPI0015C6FFAE|nr:hypothetical protein [Duganella sp. 1224]NYE61009.1 hypothetical protein [Duganella sp. 1224]